MQSTVYASLNNDIRKVGSKMGRIWMDPKWRHTNGGMKTWRHENGDQKWKEQNMERDENRKAMLTRA